MKTNWSKIVRLSLGGSMVAAFLCASLQQVNAAVLGQYTFQALDGSSSDGDVNSVAGTFGPTGLPLNFELGPSGTTSVSASAGDMGAALDTAQFFSFTISPAVPGVDRLNMSGTGALTFDYGRSSQMVAFNWAVRSSVLGFGTDIATGSIASPDTSLTASIDLSTAYDAHDTTIEFRLYVWDNGDTAASRKGYFDNVVLNGTVTSIPEPINVALGVFGLCLAGVGVGRRYLRKRS